MLSRTVLLVLSVLAQLYPTPLSLFGYCLHYLHDTHKNKTKKTKLKYFKWDLLVWWIDFSFSICFAIIKTGFSLIQPRVESVSLPILQ